MKYLFAFLSISLIMISCNGSSSSDQEGLEKYFIQIGDKKSKLKENGKVEFQGDGISNEGIFTVGKAKLYLFEFYNLAMSHPSKLKNESFGAIIDFEESLEGKATITQVTETEKGEVGESFDLFGDFTGNNGVSGSFCVSYFHM